MTTDHEAVLREMLAEAEEGLLALDKTERTSIEWVLDNILAKLPKTADGVRVIPIETTKVWCIDLEERVVQFRHNPRSPSKRKNGWWTWPSCWRSDFSDRMVSECYSTREAAEQAAKELTP